MNGRVIVVRRDLLYMGLDGVIFCSPFFFIECGISFFRAHNGGTYLWHK